MNKVTDEMLIEHGFCQETYYIFSHKYISYAIWVGNGYWGDFGVIQLRMGLVPLVNLECQYEHQLKQILEALNLKVKA